METQPVAKHEVPDQGEASVSGPAVRRGRGWRYGWGRWLLAGVAAVCLLVACVPSLLSWSPLSNLLVDWALAGTPVRADVRRAAFGWFSPLRLEGLTLHRWQGDSLVSVRRVAGQRSILGTFAALPDLGEIRVDGPEIDLVLSDPPLPRREPHTAADQAAEAAGDPRLLPTFAATIQDAGFRLRQSAAEEPVVQIENVQVTVRVEKAADQPWLVVEPTRILDHQELTPELCNQGLQLVVPLLADAVHVRGDVSFELTKFRVPLMGTPVAPEIADPTEGPDRTRGSARMAEIHGLLELHAVETAGKSPLARQVTGLLARFLNLPDVQRIRLAEESQVRFEVRGGRVYHEGLRFGLPEVSEQLVIATRGSVGFDETLDLQLEIPLPATLLAQGPLAQRIAVRPLVLQVRGTLDDPQVGLPPEQNWLEEVASRLLDDDPELLGGGDGGTEGTAGLAESIVDLAGQLLEQRRQRSERDEPVPLLERIRQRRAAEAQLEPPGARQPGSEPEGQAGGEPADPSAPRRRLFQRNRRLPPAG